MTESTEPPEELPAHREQRDPHAEAIRVAVKQLAKFAGAHGGDKATFVEYLSASTSRIVVVAQDGRWGDVVLPSFEAAQKTVAKLGFTAVDEWERETIDAVTSTGYEWGRMGKGKAAAK